MRDMNFEKNKGPRLGTQWRKSNFHQPTIAQYHYTRRIANYVRTYSDLYVVVVAGIIFWERTI